MSDKQQLKPGYKNIEGKIPLGWTPKRLKEVIKDIGDGGTPSRKKKEYFNGNIPWMVIEDIKKEIFDTREHLSEKGLKNSSAKLWPKSTVILSFGATIGEVGIARVPVATKQGIAGIVPDTDQITPEFLYYLLQFHKNLLIRFAHRTTISEIRPPTLRELMFAFPPLPEQQKIAEILSTADEAIQKINEIIAKTQKLKKGLVQQLLTQGIEHKKFKRTKIGEIPEEWKVVKLAEVASVRYGLGQPPEADENGVPMIRATNIKRGKIVETNLLRVRRSAVPESREAFLKAGDVIVVRSGAYTGDIGYVTEKWEGAIAGYDLVISPSDRIDPIFLTNYLLSSRIQGYFSQLKSRSAQPHLNAQQVSDTPLALPPLPEQKKIASILSAVDEKIEMERQRKEHLEKLKKGLMQDLLTGRVRV